MKKSTLILALLFSASGLFAQKQVEGHWGAKYLDVAYAAAATNDGGYIITGLTISAVPDNNGDIIVIKIAASGDTMWSFVLGGPYIEGGNSVIQTADGGYMVGGHTEDFGAKDCDAFLMKLDKNGTRQWLKVYGGDQDDICEGVLEQADGSFVFAGISASYGNNGDTSGRRHVYFVKTNSTGQTIWEKYYAGGTAEYAYSLAAGHHGGFLATGWSNSFGNGEMDGWLLRLNDDGDTLWTRLYPADGDSKLWKIIPTQDNGYMVAGYTTKTRTCKPQGLMIKLDADGRELWKKTYGDTTENIMFRDVAQLPDGNFMFTGYSHAADTTGNIYILTTDHEGNKISDNLCGGTGSSANCIAVQGNNSYLVAGQTAKYGDSYGDLYWMEMNNTIAQVPSVKVAAPHFYPNPVTDNSIIILPAAEAYQYCRLDITDLTGKVVIRQEKVPAKDLVISHNLLRSGIYMFRVTCFDGKIFDGKFVVN
jgi:hypothetical protein